MVKPAWIDRQIMDDLKQDGLVRNGCLTDEGIFRGQKLAGIPRGIQQKWTRASIEKAMRSIESLHNLAHTQQEVLGGYDYRCARDAILISFLFGRHFPTLWKAWKAKRAEESVGHGH